MIGHELGGRYEIMARIGGGGMALVYKAQDLLLNRFVAVKILRQQFVHDEEFIQRFRREAQSAASLSHPNVVSIYDVGREEDVHYIVMEYVEGSNLNEIIQERAPLQSEESVRIAAQICDALEHAHQNHIIHRDIKPHNILIGKNGRVKVTDFGIARAATSSTITQTGSVVGSVHYFSPEHAKGVSMGEKSDLYSLGIVLYQMVTGRLPFLGESPISVALKHLQEDFEEPRAVNPHIPQSVENIILKSMRKNPGERYESASEMLADLETCLNPDRLHEPKLRFADDLDETRVMPALRRGVESRQTGPAREGNGSREREGAVVWEREGAAVREPVGPRESAIASSAAESKAADAPGSRWVEEEKKGRRAWVKPFLIVLGTLIVLALLYLGLRLTLHQMDPGEIDVPYVVSKTEAEARQTLTDAGLRVEEPVVYETRDDIPKGIVYQQSKMNMTVKKGAFIKLYVSSGPQLETMTDYSGQSYADAKNALLALGVADSQITQQQVYDESADAGTVLKQSPAAGEQFDPKTAAVTLTVSKGKETFSMPNLVGLTQQEALAATAKAGLNIDPSSGIVPQESYKEKGTVLEQFPYKEGDQVSKGASVTINVSSGLPADALSYTFNISISPAKTGKPSDIRIVYSDARGENIEWGKKRIKDTMSFPIDLVLAPNSEATVTVYRDGQFVDTFPVTYEQVQSGEATEPASVAGEATPPPADNQPPADGQADSEGSGANGQTGQEQGGQDQQDDAQQTQ